MEMRANLVRIAAAVVFVTAFAIPSSAQVTGSVAGSVKDAQGGVIPGATITLVSETRGVRLPPAITSVNGDFVFVNVTADTYTLEVTMIGFKTVLRKGVAVSPADRVAIPTITLEVGGVAETVDVKGDTPLIQAFTGERSFTVATDSVANLPLADRNFATLASLAPGVDGTGTHRRRRRHELHDGRRLDDGHRQQPPARRRERGVDRRSQGPRVRLSGRVRPIERASDHGGDASSGTNRFRGSVYDVERNSDWNSNTKTNKLNGDPKAITKQREWGYSIGGPVGKPGGRQQAVLLLQPRISAADRREQRGASPDADVARASGRFLADDRQQRQSVSVHPRHVAHGRVATRRVRPPASPTAASSAASRQDRLYQTGLNILKMFPMPTGTAAPGVGLQLRDHAAVGKPAGVSAGHPPRLPAAANSCARRSRCTDWSQRKQTVNGSIPGFNDTRMQNPRRRHDGDHRQLQPERRRRSSRAPTGRASNEQARVRAERQRAELLHGRASDEPELPTAIDGRARRPAVPVSGREHPQSGLLRLRRAQRRRAADLGRHAHPDAAGLHVGRPRRQRAAEHPVPGLPQREPDRRTSRSA